MFRFICGIVAVAVLGLMIWACSPNRAVGPEIEPAASKPSVQADYSVIIFTLKQGRQPITGALVEFSSKEPKSYSDPTILSKTDENGQVDFECEPGETERLYQVRAWVGDEPLSVRGWVFP